MVAVESSAQRQRRFDIYRDHPRNGASRLGCINRADALCNLFALAAAHYFQIFWGSRAVMLEDFFGSAAKRRFKMLFDQPPTDLLRIRFVGRAFWISRAMALSDFFGSAAQRPFNIFLDQPRGGIFGCFGSAAKRHFKIFWDQPRSGFLWISRETALEDSFGSAAGRRFGIFWISREAALQVFFRICSAAAAQDFLDQPSNGTSRFCSISRAAAA